MSQAHILLIDDEAIALDNLSHVLEREGHRITACKDGAEGMAALAREDFDLVLTDLKMPGVDGMEVLRQVRQKHTDTPVVMITGHATLDSAVEAMKAGAFHYLAKPFRLAEAREVVKSALELCRVKRENQELRLRIESLDKPHTIVTQDIFLYDIVGEDQNGSLIGRHRSTGITKPQFAERARYFNEEPNLIEALERSNIEHHEILKGSAVT